MLKPLLIENPLTAGPVEQSPCTPMLGTDPYTPVGTLSSP